MKDLNDLGLPPYEEEIYYKNSQKEGHCITSEKVTFKGVSAILSKHWWELNPGYAREVWVWHKPSQRKCIIHCGYPTRRFDTLADVQDDMTHRAQYLLESLIYKLNCDMTRSTYE